MFDCISTMYGICRGLPDLDYGMVASVADPEELTALARRATDIARTLKGVKAKLTEVGVPPNTPDRTRGLDGKTRPGEGRDR